MRKNREKIGILNFDSCGQCHQNFMEVFLVDQKLCRYFEFFEIKKSSAKEVADRFDFLVFFGDQELVDATIIGLSNKVLNCSLKIGNCPGDKKSQINIKALGGCPIDRKKISNFFYTKIGLEDISNSQIPVCYYCPTASRCHLRYSDQPCFGPLSIGNCQAACLKKNSPCIGCQGKIESGNLYKMQEQLAKIRGESNQEDLNLFNFNEKYS